MKRRRRVRRCLPAFSALNSPGINFSAAFRGSGRRIRIIRTTQASSLLYNMYIVASETPSSRLRTNAAEYQSIERSAPSATFENWCSGPD